MTARTCVCYESAHGDHSEERENEGRTDDHQCELEACLSYDKAQEEEHHHAKDGARTWHEHTEKCANTLISCRRRPGVPSNASGAAMLTRQKLGEQC